tara:strand:+ start:1193 stop:2398 length:1206 start_codon:yes stop_codon:yes gene_type:complete
MDYITRLYQSKASQLQEQVNFLEAQLQQLVENSPPASTFSGTGQGQQTFNDEQLKDQMRQHKRSGFFGAEVADDKQTQEYKDARDELARRSAPKSAPTPATPATPAAVKAPAPKKSGSVADTGADAGGYGPPSSMYEPPVQDPIIPPPANASPRVQATDADGKPSNTPEARGRLQKDAMNPSGAYTPTPKTNERRNREEAERQGYWRDGADHGSARPAEPTAPQKEFEVSTQQPTTGVGPTGETLPQAEKRVAAYKKSGMGDLQQAWKNAATPRYSTKPGSDNSGADTQEDQTANNWNAGQFVNNLLYNRKFKGEQDARTPAQDPDMANGAYSQKPAWAQAKERAIDSWGQGSLPNNSGGMKNAEQAAPNQVSTQDNRPTSGRKPNYPSSTNDLLRLYGVK